MTGVLDSALTTNLLDRELLLIIPEDEARFSPFMQDSAGLVMLLVAQGLCYDVSANPQSMTAILLTVVPRFEKSLFDLIKGLRSHKGAEDDYIQNSLRECKVEIRSQDMGMWFGVKQVSPAAR